VSEPSDRPLHWGPLAPLLLSVAAVLMLLAVVTRNPVPLFLALPLLLAPIAAGVGAPRRSPSVTIALEVGGAASEVKLRGSVRPGTGVDARDLVVVVRRPPGLVGDPLPRFERSATEVRFQADWFAPVPTIVEVEVPFVAWRDPLGVVERVATSSAAPVIVTRYPPELLRIGAVHLEHTTMLTGETPSHRVGESGEFHGVRSARPNDPPRRINWRASARAGRLLANEYDLEKTGDILLLLDARPTPLGRDIDEHLFSVARAAAVGLAESFLAVKARVGLGVFGEFLDAVPLSTGRTQRVRIEDALRRARMSSVAAPPERCAVSVRRHFTPGLTTVVFSSLADERSTDLAPYLRRRGYPVVVLSPSPLPILAGRSTLPPADEVLARRLTTLVRRNRVARAWQEAPTIDWDDYWSLGRFVDFVRRPRTRRAG
jgi:uncharacterized protein (DUF58 family)